MAVELHHKQKSLVKKFKPLIQGGSLNSSVEPQAKELYVELKKQVRDYEETLENFQLNIGKPKEEKKPEEVISKLVSKQAQKEVVAPKEKEKESLELDLLDLDVTPVIQPPLQPRIEEPEINAKNDDFDFFDELANRPDTEQTSIKFN